MQPNMKRLILLYITIEQRSAIEELFSCRSWNFCESAIFLSETLKEIVLPAIKWKLNDELADGSNTGEKPSTEINTEQTTSKHGDITMSDSNDNVYDSLKSKENLNNEPTFCNELNNNVSDVNMTYVLRSRSRNCKEKTPETVCVLKGDSASDLLTKQGLIFVPNEPKAKKCKKNQVEKNCYDDFLRNNEKTNSTVKISDELLADNNSIVDENSETRNEFETIRNEDVVTVDHDSLGNDRAVKKKYKCEKCDYVATVKSNLNRHVREIHSGVRYQCSICDKSFKGKHDAKMHEVHVHHASLKCVECNKQFSSVSGLRNHSKTVHKKKSLYTCQHCKQTFFYKSHYLGHINKHLGVKPFSCQKCKKTFRYKVACKLHEKNCSNESFLETLNADGSKKKMLKKNYLCDICGASGLNSKSSLRMHHFYAHSDKSQCVCSLCGKSLKGIYSLRRHMKTLHESDTTRYPCTMCDRSFTQPQSLKQHMKIHNKQYSCFCDTCGKGFLSQFKMKEHARIHTGEKPFVCSVCETYKSATKTNLLKHMKIHDKNQLPGQQRKRLKNTEDVVKCSNQTFNVTTRVTSDKTPHYSRPSYLQSVNENFSRSSILNEGQRQYINLSGMPMENCASRLSPINYNQANNMAGDGSHHDNQSQGHDPDYEVKNFDDFYDNESGNESTDLSQGLNILTIAMNIVKCEPY